MVYDTSTETHKVAAVPSSGLRRRHSGDKRADRLFVELHQEAQPYRQNSYVSQQQQQQQRGSRFCQIAVDDTPQWANPGPAKIDSATALLSSSTEQSSSSGWSCTDVLKRFSSLGSALPRMQLPLVNSGLTPTSSSSAGSKQQESISTAVVARTANSAIYCTPQNSARVTSSNSNKRGADIVTTDDATSTAVSREDWTRDAADGAGPDQDQSRTPECVPVIGTGSSQVKYYMTGSAPSGLAGVPSTKLLISTAAGVVGRGLNIKAAKHPCKSD